MISSSAVADGCLVLTSDVCPISLILRRMFSWFHIGGFMTFPSVVVDGTPLALPITFGCRLPLAVADRSVVRFFAVAEESWFSVSNSKWSATRYV